jgi:hypothetical protein
MIGLRGKLVIGNCLGNMNIQLKSTAGTIGDTVSELLTHGWTGEFFDGSDDYLRQIHPSNDSLHQRTAQCFLNPTQMYLKGADLKVDLVGSMTIIQGIVLIPTVCPFGHDPFQV